LAKKLFGKAMPNKPMLATNAGAFFFFENWTCIKH